MISMVYAILRTYIYMNNWYVLRNSRELQFVSHERPCDFQIFQVMRLAGQVVSFFPRQRTHDLGY